MSSCQRIYTCSKALLVCALLAAILILPEASAAASSLEQVISSRYSVRTWTTDTIPNNLLLEVLRSGYGYYDNHRTIPRYGSSYSLDLFVANATGTYRYVPEQNILTIHSLSVTKEMLRSRFDQGYPADANAVIIIMWNQTRMNNQYLADEEAGSVVQNTYLASITYGLGTVCVALIDSNGLRSDLGLSSGMIPLVVMPIGYPTNPYPSTTPDFARMKGNLPPVEISQTSFVAALNRMTYSQAWVTETLSTKEISQLLWTAYGYSSSGHRTVASAGSVYPIRIWVLNTTGAFEYNPETHSLTVILQGDKRSEIAQAFGSQTWVAKAPTIFLVIYDSNRAGNYGHQDWFEVEAGLVTQNILLEATAWNLTGNVISLESYNGASAVSIRSQMNMPSYLTPLCAVTVGHNEGIPEFPQVMLTALFFITATAILAFISTIHRKRELRNAKEFIH